MSDGENKESEPGPPQPATVWLPPRLRDRLEHSDEPPPKSESGVLGAVVLVVILGLAGAGLWWVNQRKVAAAKAETTRIEAERAAVVADSLATIVTADSMRAVARADSAAAFLKLPVWKQKEILGGGAAASGGGPNLDEEGNFVVDAGTFLFEDAAQSAAATIQAATKLPVRMAPIEADGSTSYHVYVGKFSVRGAAAHAADEMFEKGTITQAKVVKLSSK